MVDNVIEANRIARDQPRSRYFNAPCDIEANADFERFKNAVKKFADIGPAFEAIARRREAKAVEEALYGTTCI